MQDLLAHLEIDARPFGDRPLHDALEREAQRLELDLRDKGLGVRGKRFSMIVNNGTVEKLNIDEGKYELTGAEATCGLP